jgi:Stage II sporulation protein E (SpoIIE)
MTRMTGKAAGMPPGILRWTGKASGWARGSRSGLFAIALLVGAGSGLGAVVFRYLIYFFTWVATGHSQFGQQGYVGSAHLPWLGLAFFVVIPVIGGLLYGPLTADGELRSLAPAVFATPLGLHPDLHSSTFTVRAGDRLLFFTDGLLEARDRAGRFFRLDEHIEALRRPGLQTAVDELLDRLRAHTRHHLDDDVAVLLAELVLTGPAPPRPAPR